MTTADQEPVPSPAPLHAFKFDGPEIHPVTEYTPLQTAIMPIVGVADGVVTPFATGFSISTSLPLIVTAWHVIDEFVDQNLDGLSDGSCYLAVLYESDERLPGTDLDLGGPMPVYQVAHRSDSDLALLVLFETTSRDRLIRPGSIAPISFGTPPADDYCYGFGYPHLKGGPIRNEDGRPIVEFQRTLHRTGGRVIETFPDGQEGHAMVPGPSFHCDAPAPSGMSGGPVSTDRAGICGALSSSLEPYEDTDPWTTYVTLLRPLLDFRVTLLDEDGSTPSASVRDLVENGSINAAGDLPATPTSEASSTETLTFGVPGQPPGPPAPASIRDES